MRSCRPPATTGMARSESLPPISLARCGTAFCLAYVSLPSHGLECQMFPDDLTKKPRRMNGLEAAVKIDRRSDAAVPQYLTNRLVFAGSILQEDGRRGVPELMDRDAQTD